MNERTNEQTNEERKENGLKRIQLRVGKLYEVHDTEGIRLPQQGVYISKGSLLMYFKNKYLRSANFSLHWFLHKDQIITMTDFGTRKLTQRTL